MSRILEKDGVNNTNIDGARFNNFCAGERSGIIKSTLNECAITTPSSSVINIETGELLVSGVRVVLNSPTNFTFSTFPSSATRYSLIAEIVIDSNSDITSRIFVQLANSALVQNDLFETETGAGTYQIELAKFTLTSTGVEDLVRTVNVITGGMGGDGAHWEVGEIVTNTLEQGLEAEVDIDYNENTKKYDFTFSIPNGNGIASIIKTNTTENIDTYTITFTDDTTTTFNITNSLIQDINGKSGVHIVLKTDDISDTDQTNKFVTDTEKEVWNAKEPPLPARPEVNEESKFLGWDGTGNKVWKEVSGTGGSIATEITLLKDNWLEESQTVEIEGKIETQNAIVSNSNNGTNEEVLENNNAISEANIYKIIDNGTSLTFVCEITPTVDLKLLVLVGV
jgi:hypothetical protein